MEANEIDELGQLSEGEILRTVVPKRSEYSSNSRYHQYSLWQKEALCCAVFPLGAERLQGFTDKEHRVMCGASTCPTVCSSWPTRLAGVSSALTQSRAWSACGATQVYTW